MNYYCNLTMLQRAMLNPYVAGGSLVCQYQVVHSHTKSPNENTIVVRCCADQQGCPCKSRIQIPVASYLVPHLTYRDFKPFPYPLPEIPTYVKISNPISSLQLEED
jgi:hypothetical protein